MALLLEQMLGRWTYETEVGGEEESDDEEYVYVSALAEQIASHAMLQDDDDDETNFSPGPPTPSPGDADRMLHARKNRNNAILSWEVRPLTTHSPHGSKAGAQALTDEHYDLSESSFPSVSRDHCPSECDCFYRSNLTYYHPELASARQFPYFSAEHSSHLNRPEETPNWNLSARVGGRSALFHQLAARNVAFLGHAIPAVPASASFQRNESIGTGVFLPKIVSSSSNFRRKSGLYVKPANPPRSRG